MLVEHSPKEGSAQVKQAQGSQWEAPALREVTGKRWKGTHFTKICIMALSTREAWPANHETLLSTAA